MISFRIFFLLFAADWQKVTLCSLEGSKIRNQIKTVHVNCFVDFLRFFYTFIKDWLMATLSWESRARDPRSPITKIRCHDHTTEKNSFIILSLPCRDDFKYPWISNVCVISIYIYKVRWCGGDFLQHPKWRASFHIRKMSSFWRGVSSLHCFPTNALSCVFGQNCCSNFPALSTVILTIVLKENGYAS